MKPKVSQSTKGGYWSMTLDFPDGEKVVITDAAAEDSFHQNVVVTVVTDPLHPVLLRSIEVWPGRPAPEPEDIDILKGIARDRAALRDK